MVNKNQTYYMCNDESYIANETARGQLEDTQYKTKFRHLWAHKMCQGKTSAKLREKPTDNLASTLLVTQNNADTTNQNSITTMCKKFKRVTQMDGVQIHTQTAIKLKMSTRCNTTAAKLQ